MSFERIKVKRITRKREKNAKEKGKIGIDKGKTKVRRVKYSIYKIGKTEGNLEE
jgi:hypothetical protein